MLNKFFLYLLISNVAKQLHVSISHLLCFSNLHSQPRWNTSGVCSAGIPAVLELLFCSSILVLCRLEVDHLQPTAPRHFNVQQSCCCSCCLLLPLSIRADQIQMNFKLLIIRLRLRCPRDEFATATALRTCSDPAPARKERKRTRESKLGRAAAAKRHLPKYVQIHANTVKYIRYVCDTDMSVYNTDCQCHIRTGTYSVCIK